MPFEREMASRRTAKVAERSAPSLMESRSAGLVDRTPEFSAPCVTMALVNRLMRMKATVARPSPRRLSCGVRVV